MAKILLAHPLFLAKSPEENELSSPYFPLGLLYLAGYVREQGHEVAIFDGTFCADESEFSVALAAEQPDVVGISALQPTRETALELARLAGRWGAPVIVGGPDPTASPALYLAPNELPPTGATVKSAADGAVGITVDPVVDIVVHHEGEQTIASLLDLVDQGRLDLDALAEEPGVAFRRGGEIVINQPRPPIQNLDELPLPARDLIDMDRYLQRWEDDQGYASITIATARGCPFSCQWCRDSVHGDGFRQRSPESVAAEVKALTETYKIERLRFTDDVDGIDRQWFDRWAEASTQSGAAIPFEPLNEPKRTDLPLLDVRDSL